MYKILCFFALLCAMLVSCGGDTMRVMSYNVHHCRGVDGKIDYARIAEVINRVSPDFVALQELD
ncbi:MAG: metallophosphoesterase, partial [Bacteroidaceae bacterium]|nr:metallophosphoesterase [Bacteroidaceae bacterium]